MMALHGPILAAIDLTDTADEVLAQACAVASRLKTRLVVCHIVPDLLEARMLFPQLAAADAAAQAGLAERAQEAVAARVAAVSREPDLEVDLAVESGSAHAGILNQVERVGAGLLVVGPGHVADRVTRYAPCSVLVTRPSEPGSVLAATDFSDPSLPAIEVAAAEAQRRGARLRLLYCLEAAEPIVLGSDSLALGVVPMLPGEVAEELVRGADRRLREILARLNVDGDCVVSRARAAGAIVKASHDTPTELIVIGTRGRSNLSRLLLGNVAEAVLHEATCSVIVVPLAR